MPSRITTSQVRITYLPVIRRGPDPIKSVKKGIAPNYLHCEDWSRTGATWMYVYGAPTGYNCYGIESIAMINAASQIGVNPGGNSSYLLTFNEPELQGLSPEQATLYWERIEQVYPSYKLIAPAIVQGDTEWLVEFRDIYRERFGHNPRLAGLAIHCYAPLAEICMDVIEQVIVLANEWSVSEVWVSEFGLSDCWESWDDLERETTKLVEWMEANPHITRYAWYTNRMRGDEPWWPVSIECQHTLFNYDTELSTPYGRLYAGIP